MELEYKYQDFFSEQAECPPVCKPMNTIAYRWIFEDLHHPNNFIPVLRIAPGRLMSEKFQSDIMKCLGYALSMFDSKEHAVNAHKRQTKRIKQFGKYVGEFVATIKLDPEDGKGTDTSNNSNNIGHFDFFEAKECNLEIKILDVEPV